MSALNKYIIFLVRKNTNSCLTITMTAENTISAIRKATELYPGWIVKNNVTAIG